MTAAVITHRPAKLLTSWLLLLIDQGMTYGWQLRSALEERHLTADPSAVYRTLRGLEESGHVRSSWASSTVAGPRRRLYALTAAGRHELEHSTALLTSVRDAHDAFLRERSRSRERMGTAAS